jgi:hypothetical protein
MLLTLRSITPSYTLWTLASTYDLHFVALSRTDRIGK